jgi:short-subunit dehydrogenase involved in D-alanine esterification of teichoic acids
VGYNVLELSSEESIREFTRWIDKTHRSFDVLLNNAAIMDKVKIDQRQTSHLFETNLFGTISLTEHLLPFLSMNGKVVCVSAKY